MILKPKSLKVYVPGHGVIDKADFTEEHLKACLKQIKAAKIDEQEYLRKRFDVVSYGDMPLFTESEEAAKKAEEKAAAKAAEEEAERIAAELKAKEEEAARLAAEEAELLKQIEAEEAAKKAQTPQA
jgi:dTMP kinase